VPSLALRMGGCALLPTNGQLSQPACLASVVVVCEETIELNDVTMPIWRPRNEPLEFLSQNTEGSLLYVQEHSNEIRDHDAYYKPRTIGAVFTGGGLGLQANKAKTRRSC
jgi:hypothetical protein